MKMAILCRPPYRSMMRDQRAVAALALDATRDRLAGGGIVTSPRTPVPSAVAGAGRTSEATAARANADRGRGRASAASDQLADRFPAVEDPDGLAHGSQPSQCSHSSRR